MGVAMPRVSSCRRALRSDDTDAFLGEVYLEVMPYPAAKSTRESPGFAATLRTGVGIIRKAA
jgi:hypothetical protein